MATAVAGFKGRLTLAGDFMIAPQAARMLLAFRTQELNLAGLDVIDAETAQRLAATTAWSGDLPNLTSLDVPSAKAIAQFEGESLRLCGLTRIDAATAEALAAFKGREFSLAGLRMLEAETATARTRSRAWSGEVWHMTTLSADVVRVLAERAGDEIGALRVRGLTTLDEDTAKVLASSRAWDGSLPNLRAIDSETAQALAEFEGKRLSMSGLTTLNAATAKALASVRRWDGDLSRLTALECPDSVDVATALAARQGPLSLPALVRISPKTLSALLEKEDVEIPPIEKLELIQEPDGSPTDDFMIPKGFEYRLRRQRTAPAADRADRYGPRLSIAVTTCRIAEPGKSAWAPGISCA